MSQRVNCLCCLSLIRHLAVLCQSEKKMPDVLFVSAETCDYWKEQRTGSLTHRPPPSLRQLLCLSRPESLTDTSRESGGPVDPLPLEPHGKTRPGLNLPIPHSTNPKFLHLSSRGLDPDWSEGDEEFSVAAALTVVQVYIDALSRSTCTAHAPLMINRLNRHSCGFIWSIMSKRGISPKVKLNLARSWKRCWLSDWNHKNQQVKRRWNADQRNEQEQWQDFAKYRR